MVEAGENGTQMVCPDGRKRLIFPILATYIADYPEQCQAACCRQNRCPIGLVEPNDRGELGDCPLREASVALSALLADAKGHPGAEDDMKRVGMRPIYPPFWAKLPYTDFFNCFTPDLLHQIHIGIFKGHLVKWCQELMASGELDRRFKSVPSHPSLRHFSKAITHTTQWTGTEYKMMEWVFIGVVGGSVNDNHTIEAARALLDFTFLTQLPVHTAASLS